MLKLKSKNLLEEMIKKNLKDLSETNPGSEEYEQKLSTLERLYKLREGNSRKPSADAIVAAAVALLQVGIMIYHEEYHNLTSKALSFITKPRF